MILVTDPSLLTDAVVMKREVILATLEEKLENLIEPLLRDGGDPLTVIHHLQKLQSVGLWPISSSFCAATIKSICGKLRRYPVCNQLYCGCRRIGLMARVRALADEANAQTLGLLLGKNLDIINMGG